MRIHCAERVNKECFTRFENTQNINIRCIGGTTCWPITKNAAKKLFSVLFLKYKKIIHLLIMK